MADVTDEDRQRAREWLFRSCALDELLAAERAREAARWQEEVSAALRDEEALHEGAMAIAASAEGARYNALADERDCLRALLGRVREALRAPWCSSRDRALIAAIDAALGEKP